MKRKIGLLLIFLLLMACAAASADDTRISGLYTYSIKGNGTVSIIDYDWNSSSGDIYIPSMLDGYSVTAIGEEAFAEGKKVNQNEVLVVIPDSITIIGGKAFYNSPISTISIPSSVQSIGKGAFAYCDLTQFIVDQKQPYFTTIDGVLYDKRNKALLAHPQKKTISGKIPEGILSVSEYAFSGMTIGQGDSLASTVCFTDLLPSTLTKIEAHAFENCTLFYSTNTTGSGITYFNSATDSITLLPKPVTAVGEYAFAGCTFKCRSHSSPKTVILAERLDEIGDYAFTGCRFYDNFEYDLLISRLGITRIGNFAFASSVMYSKDNERMKVRIHLPEAVDEIGENAFFETHPVHISQETQIRTIGVAAFRNTVVYTDLKKEKYESEKPVSLSICGRIRKIPSLAYAYKYEDDLNTVETISIQEGITVIEDSAFIGRKSLQTVLLPSTLTEIGEEAFIGCNKLLEITLPEGIMKIGDNAFERQYVTLIVKENSYAALWASENGYNYRYEENGSDLDWLNPAAPAATPDMDLNDSWLMQDQNGWNR